MELLSYFYLSLLTASCGMADRNFPTNIVVASSLNYIEQVSRTSILVNVLIAIVYSITITVNSLLIVNYSKTCFLSQQDS